MHTKKIERRSTRRWNVEREDKTARKISADMKMMNDMLYVIALLLVTGCTKSQKSFHICKKKLCARGDKVTWSETGSLDFRSLEWESIPHLEH